MPQLRKSGCERDLREETLFEQKLSDKEKAARLMGGGVQGNCCTGVGGGQEEATGAEQEAEGSVRVTEAGLSIFIPRGSQLSACCAENAVQGQGMNPGVAEVAPR